MALTERCFVRVAALTARCITPVLILTVWYVVRIVIMTAQRAVPASLLCATVTVHAGQETYPVGRVDAVSIETGRVAWTHQQRAGMISGLVATAGGLVFGGDANRRFKALDDRTGRVLWETILSGPVTGHPISYRAGGRQFIAVPVGVGTAEPERRVLSIHPEMKPSRGINAIFVFALPASDSG